MFEQPITNTKVQHYS